MFKKRILMIVMSVVLAACCSCHKKEEAPGGSVAQETPAAEDEEVIAEVSGGGNTAGSVPSGNGSAGTDIIDPGESYWQGHEGMSPDELPVIDTDNIEECIDICEIDGLNIDFEFKEEPTEEDAAVYAKLMKETRIVLDPYESVQPGDVVNVDMYADDESLTRIGYLIRVGYGTEPEELENALIGMSQNEKKKISVTYPENYSFQGLNNQTVLYSIIINTISRSDEPTDVEIGRALTYLEEETEAMNRNGFVDAAMKAFMENSGFKAYPEKMIRQLRKQYEARYTAGFASVDDFLDGAGMTRAEFKEIEDEYLSQRAKEQLVIMALQNETGITTQSEEYRQYIAVHGINVEDPDFTLFEAIVENISDRLNTG